MNHNFWEGIRQPPLETQKYRTSRFLKEWVSKHPWKFQNNQREQLAGGICRQTPFWTNKQHKPTFGGFRSHFSEMPLESLHTVSCPRVFAHTFLQRVVFVLFGVVFGVSFHGFWPNPLLERWLLLVLMVFLAALGLGPCCMVRGAGYWHRAPAPGCSIPGRSLG